MYNRSNKADPESVLGHCVHTDPSVHVPGCVTCGPVACQVARLTELASCVLATQTRCAWNVPGSSDNFRSSNQTDPDCFRVILDVLRFRQTPSTFHSS